MMLQEPPGLRLLLDTHVFLWFAGSPERLSKPTLERIADPKSEVYISAAAVWEITLKYDLGKLELPANPAVYVPEIMKRLRFHQLPITADHALMVSALPRHHTDPFDRIMIAQARLEGMTLVSVDRRIARYGVQLLPALDGDMNGAPQSGPRSLRRITSARNSPRPGKPLHDGKTEVSPPKKVGGSSFSVRSRRSLPRR
jgi:PIN domain nuclease of toxin-antitoxin system